MQHLQVPAGLSLQGATPPKRVVRRPVHPFHLRHRPFHIQPFAFAPVLPGETLQNAMLQARVVTDPVKNPLIGWWIEHYLFYVPLRGLATVWDQFDPNAGTDTYRTLVENMLLDQNAPLDDPALTSAKLYALTADGAAGSVKWLQLCYHAVVENYFRDPVTSAVDRRQLNMDGDIFYAKCTVDSVFESLRAVSELAAVDLTLPAVNDISMQDLDGRYQTWLHLCSQNMIETTFEDYLATFGVRKQKAEDVLKPELISYNREWTYPSNTINASTGAPTSALSWAITDRSDKNRFFREPGFIIGMTVARPKVYMKNQTTYSSAFLNDCFSWLPATMKDHVASSLKKFANSRGPAGAVSTASWGEGYWLDMRDLFVYGDQFINFANTETDANLVALPPVDITPHQNKSFVPTADIDALFVGTTAPTRLVRQDGVLNLHVLGTQLDHT